MFELGVAQIVGLVVNIVAIITYMDFTRSGRRGFMRFMAFWMGFPLTFCVKLFVGADPALVTERKLAAQLPPEEEDIGVPEYVREEVRTIRQERLGEGSGEPEA